MLSRPHVRVVLAVVCLVAAGWSAHAWRGERRLERARAAVTVGDAVAGARLAASIDGSGLAVRADRVRVLAAVQSGDLAAADRALRSAIDAAPNDWSLRRDRAVVLQRLGDVAAAAREIRRALDLNPRLTLPPGFLAPP